MRAGGVAGVTTLFALVLGVPLVSALVVVAARERARLVASATGVGVAAGWSLLVAATSGTDPTVVEIGRLHVEPVLAAAAAGLALLVAVAPGRTVLATSASLTALTVFAAAGAVTRTALPDRPLAAGVVVLVVLVVVRTRVERPPRLTALVLAAGGSVAALGLALDDAELATVLVMAGAGTVVVAAAWSRASAALLLPVVLLAAHRATSAPREASDGLDPVLITAVVAAVVGASVLIVLRRRPVTNRLPVAAALGALVLLTADLEPLRHTGLLLAAAAVLAAVGRHPVALLAGLPALVAGAEAAGIGTEPEHAVIGAAVVLVLAAGAVEVTSTGPAARAWRWAALPGLAFGLVPSWGWSGVGELPEYTETLAVAVAVGFVVVATVSAWPAARDVLHRPVPAELPADVPADPAPSAAASPAHRAGDPAARVVRLRSGRLVARRSASADPPDGNAHPDD